LLIINTAEKDVFEFVNPIKQILGVCRLEEELIHWTDLRGKKEIPDYAGLIISASPKGDNDNFEERLNAFQWLKDYKKPVFGICAGHQLTAAIYGARLLRNIESEEGKVMVQRTRNDPIFLGMSSEFETEQHHLDSVALPESFEVLASSRTCSIQAMKHISRPLYTVQWHAEISNPEMILNFVRIVEGFRSKL
jgi:GMP synthase (glutamine-hydrolysing)